VRTKSYGQVFLQSLPPCRVTSEIAELARIFDAPSGIQSPMSKVGFA